MELQETRHGRTLVLAPEGRLDTMSASHFQSALFGRIDAGDRSILVDLSRLDYISSSGLRILLAAAKRLGSEDGQFALCAPTEMVRDVLHVSGFDSILEIHPDSTIALAKMG